MGARGTGLATVVLAPLVALLLPACLGRSPDPVQNHASDAGTAGDGPPIVIMLIGDGMGRGQLDAASYFATGGPEGLFMFQLPQHGELVTGGPTGITDSAAAATALASGTYTYNGRVGIDRDGESVKTLVELAHEYGLGTGIVSTASITHATPAAFVAHVPSRGQELDIANEMANVTKPQVIMGGGARAFLPKGTGSIRNDDGLIEPLQALGYEYASNATELSAIKGDHVLGLFADYHVPYARERAEDSDIPSLTDMSMKAIETLNRNPKGFFLMIEGGRVDHASHANDIDNTIGEALAFDDTIRAVVEWAETRSNVTVMITADHETGGLQVSPGLKGDVPPHTWRWGGHTNARVDVFGMGPNTELFHGKVRDQRWVHAVAEARITGEPVREPAHVPIADGYLADLRYTAAVQTNESGFGVGLNQLDSLRIDADRFGLFLGIEGLFEWNKNAVVVLIDTDYGTGTGIQLFNGLLRDSTGVADKIVSGLNIDLRALNGFGVEHVFVDHGGTSSYVSQLSDATGLRGLYPPYGSPDDFGWYGAATNYGDHVRVLDAAPRQPLNGVETFIPWDRLYPDLSGAVPSGIRIAVIALLVSSDGDFASNQVLPPFPAGTMDPGRAMVRPPGAVVFTVDANGDWIGDGDQPPTVLSR